MSKHTPAPWILIRRDKRHHPGIITIGHDATEKDICELDASGDDAEGEANARLIAAAPELLDLAKRFLARFEHDIGSTAFEDAMAIINKAEGK